MFRYKVNMLRRLTNSMVLSIVFGSIVHIADAQSISSTDLINKAKQYDGKVVYYQGEVIGDIMMRGQYAWININDGQNAIGIWVSKSLIKDIVYKGSYRFRGDEVRVTGIFHRSCPEHGGDLDIHAQSIRKVISGRQIFYNLDFNKIKKALILLGILMLLSLWDLLVRKRYPKHTK